MEYGFKEYRTNVTEDIFLKTGGFRALLIEDIEIALL